MNIFLYEGAVETHKLDATSSMILFKNYIHYSSKKQENNYHFYYPKDSKNQHIVPFPELRKDNVYCYSHKMPGTWYRFHFDTNAMKEQIKMLDIDFDVIFTNDIETTTHLNELFNNRWHFDIPIVAYWDWVELPENGGNLNNFVMQCASVLTTARTGVNSQWQKQIILNYATDYFNKETLSLLDEKIQPLYIGIETDEINQYLSKEKQDRDNFRILWNHRIAPQTGFYKCIKQLDEIDKTYDITLVVTNPNSKPLPNRDYIEEHRNLDRKDYFRLIQSCNCGVGYFQKYSAWSMSITDMIACNLPVLVPNKYCFKEMMGKDYPLLFNNDNEFFTKLSLLIECKDKFNWNSNTIESIREKHDWNNRINDWIDFIDKSLSMRTIETDKSYEILDIIIKDYPIEKRDLFSKIGFGGMIKWTPYRNFLKQNGVKDEISRKTVYKIDEKV